VGIKKISNNQPLANFTDDTPLIFGDYNGDGLTDFITPQIVYDIASTDIANLFYRMQTDKKYWNVYQGNGSKTAPFSLIQRVDYTNDKLLYCKSKRRNDAKNVNSDYATCGVYALDINNDGKSDLVSFNNFGNANFDPIIKNDKITQLTSTHKIINKYSIHENISKGNSFGFHTSENNRIHLYLLSPYTLFMNAPSWREPLARAKIVV
jgi:archaellin